MPFTWVPTPQLPSPNVPEPIGESEVSYKVDVVANMVDWGGEVRYNTANQSYDVVYEFPSLNATTMNIDNAFCDTATINNLIANVLTANTTTIGNGTINLATVTYGIITGSPDSNSGVVTKEYVDNAITSISGGSGFDTTANLFLQQGDLLVGFSPNTAHRLAGGSNGQVLTVNTSSNIKVSWEDAPTPQETSGLVIGTHYHPYKSATTLLLKHANVIVMENGDYISGWSNLTANLMSSGAGGIDASSALSANTWYAVYAIYNPTNGNKALLLYRMKQRVLDQHWDEALDTEIAFLGFNATSGTNPFTRYITKISQSFIPSLTAKVYGVQLRIGTQLIPTGNCWITLEPDDGTGNASGAVLATSRTLASLERGIIGGSSSAGDVLFIFDTRATLTQGGRYHFVVNTDRQPEVTLNANAFLIYGNTAPLTDANQRNWMDSVGYNASQDLSIYLGYGQCHSWNAVAQHWSVTANIGGGGGPGPADLFFKIYCDQYGDGITLPSGYTQKALISYAVTNAQSRFKSYKQVDKTIIIGTDSDWWAWTSNTSPQGEVYVDLSYVVPPIKCTAQFLAVQRISAFGGSGTYTSAITSVTNFTNPSFTPRGVIHNQSRNGQIYPMTPIELGDTQRIVAYQADTSTDLYVTSITF